jgi:hypothetical protein
MRRFLGSVVALGLTLSLTACTLFVTEAERKQLRTQVQWNYAKNGIRIDYRAAKTMNVYKGSSHPLMLAVLQVEATSDADNLLKTSTGIAKLLSSGESGDKQKGFDKHYIQPGETGTWTVDRPDGTQYIYVIAAYVDLIPGTGTVRSFEVPLSVTSGGVLFLSKSLTPAPLELSVELGEQQFVSVVNHSEE